MVSSAISIAISGDRHFAFNAILRSRCQRFSFCKEISKNANATDLSAGKHLDPGIRMCAWGVDGNFVEEKCPMARVALKVAMFCFVKHT